MHECKTKEHTLSATRLENLSPSHPLFKQIVTESETLILYQATLLCQSRISKQTITNTLSGSPFWKKVEHVMDVGCGPGDVAKNLVTASLVENKIYTGVDKEPFFIQEAISKNLPSHVKFLCADVFNYQGQLFDGALLVATLQHLGNIDTVVPKLLKQMKPSGYIFCFDSLPGTLVTLNPKVPLLLEMLRQISRQGTLEKKNDWCLIELKEKAPQFGLDVLEMGPLEISVAPQQQEDYFRLSFFTSELARRFYSVDIDQEQLFQQLSFWLTSQGAATIHGFGKLILQKK